LWRRWIGTALETPQDTNLTDRARVARCSYRATARSVVILFNDIG
jgi:hypothetical protein